MILKVENQKRIQELPVNKFCFECGWSVSDEMFCCSYIQEGRRLRRTSYNRVEMQRKGYKYSCPSFITQDKCNELRLKYKI